MNPRSDPQGSGPRWLKVTRRGLAPTAANRPKPPDMAAFDGFLSPSMSGRTPHFYTGLEAKVWLGRPANPV